MFSEDFKPKKGGEEKDFLIFVTITGIFILIHILVVLFSPTYQVSSEPEVEVSEFISENTTISDTWNFVLQDGGGEVIESTFSNNWSEDGWVLTSIIVEISYDESATADFDCDTVSAELTILGSEGDEPDTSTTSASVSDCSTITLDMKWPDLVEDSSIGYFQSPFEIVGDISLNVDSTIPGNDNDEQIDVSIEVIMSRVMVIE